MAIAAAAVPAASAKDPVGTRTTKDTGPGFALGGAGPIVFNCVIVDVRPPTTPLTDGVVKLRRLRVSDRPPVLAIMGDSIVRRWLNMPEQPTESDFDELLQTVSDGWSAGTRWDLAITDATDTVVGAVIASKRHRDNWELAYLAGESGRGRGLVTRSVRLVCSWLFAEGVGRIEVRTHPENAPSQHVAERCGFHLEGRERRSIWLHGRRQDALVWSLLPTDRQ